MHTHRRHHVKLQQTELHAVGINELVQQSIRVQRLLFALLIELHGGCSALEHACGFAVLRSLRLQRQKCGAVCCHSRSLLVCLSMTMLTFQRYMIVCFQCLQYLQSFADIGCYSGCSVVCCSVVCCSGCRRSLLQRSLKSDGPGDGCFIVLWFVIAIQFQYLMFESANMYVTVGLRGGGFACQQLWDLY